MIDSIHIFYFNFFIGCLYNDMFGFIL